MKYSLNFLFNEIVLLLLYHTKDNRVNLLLKIKGFQPNWTKAKRKRRAKTGLSVRARETECEETWRFDQWTTI